ncbi:MAG TPA: hypothetical protein EYP48_00290 [Ignisphaera sp.]|nr:hypothetical protein [Ignisphaera sp.]
MYKFHPAECLKSISDLIILDIAVKAINMAYPLLNGHETMTSRKIVIRLVGFYGDKHVRELEIHDEVKVKDIVGRVLDNVDEVMVICGSKQLYLDDIVPYDCRELDIYPLASGGM